MRSPDASAPREVLGPAAALRCLPMAPRATRRRRVVAADDLFRLRFVADPQISPDGTHVAYVVAWVDPNTLYGADPHAAIADSGSRLHAPAEFEIRLV